MKTLIIDNYDSFTYNLVHLFAEVLGNEPVVIKNDDPQWNINHINDFDQIVISPGPGHPAVEKDMGISTQILNQSQYVRPLLGICLGHQGLCLAEGACVSKAPEAVHGRSSIVRHNGDHLFKDIPDGFNVVRYHSLAVTQLPTQLQPLAWTDDNILMAVAHQDKPYWGLQFHPESINTQYGQQLVKNFCIMSEKYNSNVKFKRNSNLSVAIKSDLHFTKKVDNTSKSYSLWYRKLPFYRDSETIFVTLFENSQSVFWLDSNDHKSELSQISIMGDTSGSNSRCVHADIWRDSLIVENHSGDLIESADADIFSWLNSDIQSIKFEDKYIEELPFDVRPGWFGHLGYELKSKCLGTKVYKASQPDASMMFAERILVIDHSNKAIYLLALLTKERADEIEQWADTVQEKLSKNELISDVFGCAYPSGEDLKLRISSDDYLECIEECQREIAKGESYEICLTNLLTFTLNKDIDPLILYRKLRLENPTSFSAFIRWPDWSILSLSPERFMRVDSEHCAHSRPMKGTRKRSSDPKEDRALILDLASNPKDKSENLMIVDLVRNDLGRNASLCSVEAVKLFEVETYATVHQMVSTVTAKLREEATAVDCILASFPGGSMTGAPKIRTMEIIDRIEGGFRGVYSGAIGYFAVNDVADFSIVIRSLVIDKGNVTLGVGGAIIALSDPYMELEETAVKSRALLEPFGLKFPLVSALSQSKYQITGIEKNKNELFHELQQNLQLIFKENRSCPVVQHWSTYDINDKKGFVNSRIEIVGFSGDILFHAIKGDDGGVLTGSGSMFIESSDKKVDLFISGKVSECSDLESDALFSTLSRIQQLKAWFREEKCSKEEGQAFIVERYDRQAIARPNSFKLYRLSPLDWQRGTEDLTKEKKSIVRAVKSRSDEFLSAKPDTSILLIFS